MREDDDLHYSIALGMVPGVGPVLARKMIEHCGSARQAFRSTPAALLRIPGIGPWTASSIRTSEVLHKAEKELDHCLACGITVLLFSDAEFPQNLVQCPDGPYLLFVKGHSGFNGRKVVSIVGSRSSTSYGRQMVSALVEDMAGTGVLVVSGLALGIDGAAHQSCLQQGIPTAAVLGHGLDMVYPSAHRGLARRIAAEGGMLVSEYPSWTRPERMYFPARNRIVAGIADAVVIVESGVRGGALITAGIASSYNREVFAFPGRATDQSSGGCNNLILANKAALIRSAADLFEHMGWAGSARSDPGQEPPIEGLCPEEMAIYRRIPRTGGGIRLDELLAAGGTDRSTLRHYLLKMEINGLIRALPGNSFAKA